MGANHTTLSATADDVRTLLPEYHVEERLYPGSGRMMRTFRLSHKETSSLVVAKVMWTTAADEALLQQQKLELERIQEALRQTQDTHVAPFVFWKLGNPVGMNRAVALVRNHTYTTLSDRLESRPFLTNIRSSTSFINSSRPSKLCTIVKFCMGFLTTENIGLTSWNHLVILDIASYKAHAALPDDDPSDYLYYYQQEAQQQDNSSQREKRCYLAPERFFFPKTTNPPPPDNKTITLTKAMDVYSAGCIILETWLNGERALDLGDLMDYRKEESFPPSLQQKFSKIESSHLRAACRHMMTYDPTQRLTPQEYLERLHMPSVFNDTFEPLLERVKDQAPDARIAVAAAVYPDILKATVGVRDDVGKKYFRQTFRAHHVSIGEARVRNGWKRKSTFTTGHQALEFERFASRDRGFIETAG
jgi:phosphoinositide-3-kinase regulatory subunit 4